MRQSLRPLGSPTPRPAVCRRGCRSFPSASRSPHRTSFPPRPTPHAVALHASRVLGAGSNPRPSDAGSPYLWQRSPHVRSSPRRKRSPIPVHAGVAALVVLHRSPSPALPPRPDRAPRYALPKAAASTRGHAFLVLSPNRFLSSCRPPSSPETSRSRRSFHELGQTRRDSLQAGPTPLSTPSIAERRHAPGDKSAPSWAPPLHHGDADPAVPSHW